MLLEHLSTEFYVLVVYRPLHLTAYLNINTCVFERLYKHQQARYKQQEWDLASNIQQFKSSV